MGEWVLGAIPKLLFLAISQSSCETSGARIQQAVTHTFCRNLWWFCLHLLNSLWHQKHYRRLFKTINKIWQESKLFNKCELCRVKYWEKVNKFVNNCVTVCWLLAQLASVAGAVDRYGGIYSPEVGWRWQGIATAHVYVDICGKRASVHNEK